MNVDICKDLVRTKKIVLWIAMIDMSATVWRVQHIVELLRAHHVSPEFLVQTLIIIAIRTACTLTMAVVCSHAVKRTVNRLNGIS